MEEDPRFLAFVHAVAEGTGVDWDKAESDEADDSRRAVLRELRVISGIANFHHGTPRFEHDSPPSPGARSAAAEDIETQWGGLRLIELVGRGSFGDVWRAYDERLDRAVALKLLKDCSSDRNDPASRVIHEGRLLARVRHPNVVTVHGAEQIDGRVGVWMEFIQGRSLEQILRDHGPFSPQEATTIGLDLCRALSAVHHAGLLHRDIKAQNVMREAGGRVVLMDFGSGTVRIGDASDPTSLPAGTPLYLAPEIFDGQDATVQSDIYSVGVLLYHLVTASYPVHARGLADVRDAHRAGRRVWLRDARPDLSPQFVEVVERCLAAKPSERYESAGAVEAALAATMRVETEAGGPGERRLRWWLAAAVAGIVIVFSIGAALDVGGWREPLLGRLRSGDGSTPMTALGGAIAGRKVALSFPYNDLGRPSFDGRHLSYVAPDGNIAVCELATGRTWSVTVKNDSPEQAAESIVSPDGRWIAYTWFALDGAAELRVIGTDGKSPRVLIRDQRLAQPLPVEWSRDGRHILALLSQPDGVNQIALVGVDEGSVNVLKTLRSVAPHYMSLSPDGRYVVYDLPERDGAVSRDIFLVATTGNFETKVIDHPANDVFPTWTPDGHGIFFVSDRSGGMDVWTVRVTEGSSTGQPDLLKRDVGRIRPLGITAHGDYYYQLQVRMVDVYTADIDPNTGLVSGGPMPISSRFVGQNISPEWSPDGSSVAYVSMRGLVPNDRNSRLLSIVNLESGERRDLVPAMSFFIRPRWSPDGRKMLVKGRDFKNQWGIHLVDLDTSRVSPAILPSPGEGDGSIGDFEWSSDGRAILYERGGHGIAAREIATSKDVRMFDYIVDSVKRLHTGGGFQVSPDGRWLAFSGSAGGRARWQWLECAQGTVTRWHVRRARADRASTVGDLGRLDAR